MIMEMPDIVRENRHIVLVDGLCSLCSGLVSFICRRDKSALLRFAWAQDSSGREILNWFGLSSDSLDTLAYVEDGAVYVRSTAVLKLARLLGFPWNLVSLGLLFPTFTRDWVYDLISSNRYFLFGRREKCPVPGHDVRNRFL